MSARARKSQRCLGPSRAAPDWPGRLPMFAVGDVSRQTPFYSSGWQTGVLGYCRRGNC